MEYTNLRTAALVAVLMASAAPAAFAAGTEAGTAVTNSIDISSVSGGETIEIENASIATLIQSIVRPENNFSLDEVRNDFEALWVRRSAGLDFGLGIGFYESIRESGDALALRLISKLAWESEDSRLSLGLSAGKAIAESGEGGVSDQMLLTAGYDISDNLSLFGNFDSKWKDGSAKGYDVATFGFEAAPWDGGRITAGLVHAQDETNSGVAAFIGARQQFDVAEGTVMTFGLDAQHDVGDGVAPLGSSIGNPYIKESFPTATVGVRKTTDTWSAGVELSRSISEDRTAGSMRTSIDGELNDDWSIGTDLLWGFSEEAGDREEDLRLRVGAAHRGENRDPITILQLTADMDGEGSRKVYGSVVHNRYVGEGANLNLRAAAKWQQQQIDYFSFSDTLMFVGAEYRYDLSEMLDIGIHGNTLSSLGGGQDKIGYGLSVGITHFDNGQLNIGYNLVGFRDEDYSLETHTQQGVFVEFKLKVDQETFRDMFR